jgi:predicted NAD/FAD-binding protein
MDKRIAVIGSGISGALAAWLLRNHAEVTLFESDTRFGGHTNTLTIEEQGQEIAIDTGFMVYNRPNYPILSALFEHIGIRSYPTDMSFSVSMDDGRLEYAGSNLRALFAQYRNALRPSFVGMLADILRFNRLAEEALARNLSIPTTLGEFLDRHRLGTAFRRDYLYPMAAAIWSCPRDRIADFPARSFLRFFSNHGLIRLRDRPQWLTVEGGSSSYMRTLMQDLGRRAHRSQGAVAVERQSDQVVVTLFDGHQQRFDDVILACHSDQALALLRNPSADERAMLAAIPYQSNQIYLHRDRSLMPNRRAVWASWNYLGRRAGPAESAISVTYWMNSLQRLPTATDYFVSLNPPRPPRDEHVVASFRYEHPVFEREALLAQRRLPAVQGRDRIWFCGAWTGYGFHEDGARSGLEVARALGASIPWYDASQRSADLAMLPELARRSA